MKAPFLSLSLLFRSFEKGQPQALPSFRFSHSLFSLFFSSSLSFFPSQAPSPSKPFNSHAGYRHDHARRSPGAEVVVQSVEPCLSTTKAKPTTTPQALSIERKNERRRALGAPPRALALICTRVCFFFLFRALLFRFPMTRSRILLSFAPLRARWPKRGAGSRGAHENECFFFASLSSHRSFVDVGKRKKKLDPPFHHKKKNQQIARSSAPVSGRAAAPCAARAAQAASISAQVQRLSLGSVKSARAIKAASASARNVSSRAAAVAAVAEEKKPFTKVRSVFIPS